MSPNVQRRTLVLRGVLDLCLLSLLTDRPVYGYELTQRLAEQDLLVAGGSTYPLLARLEAQGLVTSSSSPSASGPRRKYYALSPAGAAALNDGRQEWEGLAKSVSALLDVNLVNYSAGELDD